MPIHTDSISENEPFDKVDAWFINPIRVLRDTKDAKSDGAFLALSASCAMYERFLIKLAQEKNKHPKDDRDKLGGEDLGIGEDKFGIFWECFRNGLQHQFQPTKSRDDKTYYWNISDKFEKIPNVIYHCTKRYTIEINPWKFAELVNQRYKENPQYFEKAKSHKPGIVTPIEASLRIDHKIDGFVDPLFPLPIQSPNTQTPNCQKPSHQTGLSPLAPQPKQNEEKK